MARKAKETGGRGAQIALARLTPQLGTATFNKAALDGMGGPTKVIFYDLGNAKAIVQPYRKTDSTVFDTLKTKKILVTGRLFSLSTRNGTAVFRTPAWLRKLKGTVVHQPVEGISIRELPECLYFDFAKAATTSMESLSAIVQATGKQTSIIETYEDTFLRIPKKTGEVEKPKAKKAKPVKAAKKVKAAPVQVEAEETETEEVETPAPTPKKKVAAPPVAIKKAIPATLTTSEDEDEEWTEEEAEEAAEEEKAVPPVTTRVRSSLRNR